MPASFLLDDDNLHRKIVIQIKEMGYMGSNNNNEVDIPKTEPK